MATTAAAKFFHQAHGALPFGFVGRQHVDVDVGVADVAEDDVLAGEFAVERFAIEREDVAASRERHREIGIGFHEAALTNNFVDGFGEGVAEAAEPLAIGSGSGEPGIVGERARGLRRGRSRSHAFFGVFAALVQAMKRPVRS